MERKTVSIRINPLLWKDARKYCLDQEISLSEFIEQAVNDKLEKK